MAGDNEKAAAEKAAKEKAEAEAAEKAAAEKAAPTRDELLAEGLIEVAKGGETLFVHHTCLAEHKLLGWREV